MKVKCPGGLLADPDPAVKDMAQRVRCRQETVNERFKNWGILNTPYRHNIFKHQAVFGAIVCLQLSFNLKSKSYPYHQFFCCPNKNKSSAVIKTVTFYLLLLGKLGDS